MVLVRSLRRRLLQVRVLPASLAPVPSPPPPLSRVQARGLVQGQPPRPPRSLVPVSSPSAAQPPSPQPQRSRVLGSSPSPAAAPSLRPRPLPVRVRWVSPKPLHHSRSLPPSRVQEHPRAPAPPPPQQLSLVRVS